MNVNTWRQEGQQVNILCKHFLLTPQHNFEVALTVLQNFSSRLAVDSEYEFLFNQNY